MKYTISFNPYIFILVYPLQNYFNYYFLSFFNPIPYLPFQCPFFNPNLFFQFNHFLFYFYMLFLSVFRIYRIITILFYIIYILLTSLSFSIYIFTPNSILRLIILIIIYIFEFTTAPVFLS